MRTMKIYQNINSGAIFDVNNMPLENQATPFVRFPEAIILDYNAINSDVITDTYNGWSSTSITAEAAIDNDYDHYIDGALTASKSGSITSVGVTIADADYVNPTGTLQLINAAGESETIAYTAFTVSGTTYTFTVSVTLTYSYASADVCKVADVSLAESYAVDYTNKATGRLLFSLTTNSRPLYELLEGNAKIDNCVMAVQVYTSDGADPDSDPDVILAQEFEIGVFNIRKYSQAIPPPMNGNYYTKTEVNAILADYMTLAATPTNGHILTTNGDGQAVDSGKAFSTDGTFAGNSDLLIPTEKAIKTYVTAASVGMWDDRGSYDASDNTFPATGGSGTAGAILKGDIWTVSVAGTLGSVAVNIGDTVRALADTPGQTAGNWALGEGNIGYVPENITNKVTSITGSSTDTQYPSAKAVNTQVDNRAHAGTFWKSPPIVTINGGDNTKVDVSAGVGYIYNYDDSAPTYTLVTYAGATAVTLTNLATSPSTEFTVDSTGTLKQYPAGGVSRTTRRNEIYIGQAIHSTNTVVFAIQSLPVRNSVDANHLRDLVEALGGVINITGNVFSANGANLNINKSAGSYFRSGASSNYKDPSTIAADAHAPASFQIGYYNGTAWVYSASTNTLPVVNYNNIASGLTAMQNNYFRIDRIYEFPPTDGSSTGVVVIHYGQSEYASITAAQAAARTAVLLDPALSGSVMRCQLIVQKDATALNNAAQSVFLEADKFGQAFGGGGSSASSGEANTISSVGTGTSIVYGKTGVDLQLKSITSTGSTITLTGAIYTVNVDLATTAITGQTEKTTPVSGDYLLITDGEASNAFKKVNVSNIGGGLTWSTLTTGTTVAATNNGYTLDGASAVITVTIPSGTAGNNFQLIIHDITNVPVLDVDTNSQTVHYADTSFTADQNLDVVGAHYMFVCIATNVWQMTAITPL